LGSDIRTDVSNVVAVVDNNIFSETGKVVKTFAAKVVELLVGNVFVSVDNCVKFDRFAVDD
jgi:hypothetical protein